MRETICAVSFFFLAIGARVLRPDLLGHLVEKVCFDLLGHLAEKVCFELLGHLSEKVCFDLLGHLAEKVCFELLGHLSEKVCLELLGHLAKKTCFISVSRDVQVKLESFYCKVAVRHFSCHESR
jgi:hypothetical protein